MWPPLLQRGWLSTNFRANLKILGGVTFHNATHPHIPGNSICLFACTCVLKLSKFWTEPILRNFPRPQYAEIKLDHTLYELHWRPHPSKGSTWRSCGALRRLMPHWTTCFTLLEIYIEQIQNMVKKEFSEIRSMWKVRKLMALLNFQTTLEISKIKNCGHVQCKIHYFNAMKNNSEARTIQQFGGLNLQAKKWF